MSRINVCFSADDNFAPYCGIAIKSMLLNKAKEDDIHIHILHKDLSAANIEKLQQAASEHERIVRFKRVLDDFDGFPVPLTYHFTVEAYFRIAIARVFPSADRMIYLDCDILVLNSLWELFNTDMNEKPLGMVMDESGKEYNSGVLLIDCKKWREEKIEDRLFLYMQENKDTIRLVDQDLINGAISERILKIERKWNFQVSQDLMNGQRIEDVMRGQEINVLHMVGLRKPWHATRNDAVTDIYFRYLPLVPWNLPDNRKRNESIVEMTYYSYRELIRQVLTTRGIKRCESLLFLTEDDPAREIGFAAVDLGIRIVRTGKFGEYSLLNRDFEFAIIQFGNILIANDIMMTYGYKPDEDYVVLPTAERENVPVEILTEEYMEFLKSLS